jgi:Acetyltransferases, including N-acetylases of ribosomal proteins
MYELATERLLLRRFVAADWKDLHEYLSQAAVVQYEPYPVYTEDECRQEALDRSQQEAFWAVCLQTNGKLIGNIYFQQQEPRDFLTWEIGYVFNPAYYGQGYATESCQEILRYGFQQLHAYRIVAHCNPQNTASWKLLERLSMRREGHLRKNIFFKYDELGRPIWIDTYEYAILAEEWFQRN